MFLIWLNFQWKETFFEYLIEFLIKSFLMIRKIRQTIKDVKQLKKYKKWKIKKAYNIHLMKDFF